MGILLEIANRVTEITQKKLATTGGTLIEVLNEELEKEKQQEDFKYVLEDNEDLDSGQVFNITTGETIRDI